VRRLNAEHFVFVSLSDMLAVLIVFERQIYNVRNFTSKAHKFYSTDTFLENNRKYQSACVNSSVHSEKKLSTNLSTEQYLHVPCHLNILKEL